jgi:hypothetical protein
LSHVAVAEAARPAPGPPGAAPRASQSSSAEGHTATRTFELLTLVTLRELRFTGLWFQHEQTLLVQGNQIAGYLDGRKWMDATLPTAVSGRVGVWTKTDSVVLVDSFTVEPAQ